MSDFTPFDCAMMARALALALRGRNTVRPNPVVGCVLAKDGEIVGEGWHARAGEAHAEVRAIESSDDPRGATAYVTLEPCTVDGRTPPCSDALVKAGITEVVYAATDPSDGVDATRALEASGISVRSGLMQRVAEQQNEGFFTRIVSGRPFVRLKIAASLDGAIAMRDGSSQWISGPDSRADVQRLRARSGAILSGIGTVLADDPSFTVRDERIDTGGLQPLRVIADSALRMPLSARMLCLPGETLVCCVDDTGRASLEDAGAEVMKIGAHEGGIDLGALLEELGRRRINDLLVESGPVLAGSLLTAGLVDELVIYQAPHIMGSETITMVHTPSLATLADRFELTVTETRRIGNDFRITGRIAPRRAD